LVVPHAGYRYSGAAAGTAFHLLEDQTPAVQRVVLIGPSHRMAFRGLAASSDEAFLTPLGAVPVDCDAVARALCLPQVRVLDGAHRHEHSLEVQLPLLQTALPQFSIVPLLVGEASGEEVAATLEALWDEPETIIVASTDLSHYQPYADAQRLDAETSQWIEHGQWEKLTGQRACGYGGLRGLLQAAQARGLSVRNLALYNSGDVVQRHDQVVGYGSYALC
jgi:AmmeMemoRadiSam system protein B